MYTLAMATTTMRMVAETRLVLANVEASGSTAPPLMARHMTAMTMIAICAENSKPDDDLCRFRSAVFQGDQFVGSTRARNWAGQQRMADRI